MKNCIITGENSGIGYQATKQVAQRGYHVTLICRNKQRTEEALSKIHDETHDVVSIFFWSIFLQWKK